MTGERSVTVLEKGKGQFYLSGFTKHGGKTPAETTLGRCVEGV